MTELQGWIIVVELWFLLWAVWGIMFLGPGGKR